jgi:hypothetical protein
MKMLIVVICMTGLMSLAQNTPSAPAQNTPPPRIAPADAQNHKGEIVTICGKVVQTKINRYGIPGHGKPVSFYLDQPEAADGFYFVTFGTGEDPNEAIAAYKDKSVCVSGKITTASGKPYIMAADRTKITPQSEKK